MLQIGKTNRLTIGRQSSYGYFLTDETGSEVLLPMGLADESMKPGDEIDVFVYRDANKSPLATTKMPLAQVGEFAYLQVIAVQELGAFLDWGLPKDLFVPHAEQAAPMRLAHKYIVHVYQDNTGRIAASSKLNRHLKNIDASFTEGQPVKLLVCEETDLGINAIADNQRMGLLYKNEVFQELHTGDRIEGYVKKVRADGKLDLSISKPSFDKNTGLQEQILEYLNNNNGHSDMTDKCAPERIYQTFGVSKKQYKKSLGMLYRQKKIRIDKDKIVLL